ncbi:metallophosphoesterase [Agrobacterium tumefaciens]|uniref:metallophosphoesterase n=1 Tax=Agrobacterium tumefaciens TaxID=358 RepID=UPI0004709C2F
MRAWIISDIHASALDWFHPRPLDIPQADICICAGDFADGIERSVDFLHAEIAPHMPVVATLGNHDFYGSSIDRALGYARKWTEGTNVHILENDLFLKKDLRIIGATLWSDYEISAHSDGWLPVRERRELATRECSRIMRDFYEIFRSGERTDGEGGLVSANELISRHKDSRAFIEKELAQEFSGTTIVLTHHAPSPRSLDPRFEGNISNAAFASDLTSTIISGNPDFWIHGHIHSASDFIEGETSVICNPRGYRSGEASGSFMPGFVVETTTSGAGETP